MAGQLVSAASGAAITGSINVTGGNIDLQGGPITGNGNVAQVVSLTNSSVLTGIGLIAIPVENTDGIVAPGTTENFGTLTVQGGYTQSTAAGSGTIDVALDNPSSSNDSDLLAVQNGTAVLGGTLNINFPNSFSGASQTYTILTDSSGISGTFGTVNVTGSGYSSSSYGVDVRYTSTAVYVDVATKPAAPTITSLSVSSVSSDGGQSETIGGTGFGDVQTVLLGGVPVESETVVSSTQINVVLPPEAIGSPNVTVSTTAGSASSSLTVTSGTVPAISSLSITGGYLAGGEAETITGTGFLGTTSVTFGSEPALSFQVDSIRRLPPMHHPLRVRER